ncbi:hypothetical protein Lser_V15G31417 [Lactuca serriola]
MIIRQPNQNLDRLITVRLAGLKVRRKRWISTIEFSHPSKVVVTRSQSRNQQEDQDQEMSIPKNNNNLPPPPPQPSPPPHSNFSLLSVLSREKLTVPTTYIRSAP